MNLTRSGLLGKLFGPPPNTPDGYVATAKASKSDGFDWEAAAGGAPTGSAGGDLSGTYPNPTVPGLLVKSVSLTITDAQIKALLATPLTLVTPAAGTAILPVAAWAIHDFSHGVYVDPDTNGTVDLFDATGLGCFNRAIPISDADIGPPSPGAAKFFSFLGGLGGQTSWPFFQLAQDGSRVLVGTGSLHLAKSQPATGEFTGGGAGNSLRITLFYLPVPTT